MEINRKYDLEERLINFAIMIIEIEELLPGSKAGNHFGGQILRSGTAPALVYGEAQSAESRADFIHKIKIMLKELRETKIILTIFQRKQMVKDVMLLNSTHKECIELISIFSKSVKTAKMNLKSVLLIIIPLMFVIYLIFTLLVPESPSTFNILNSIFNISCI